MCRSKCKPIYHKTKSCKGTTLCVTGSSCFGKGSFSIQNIEILHTEYWEFFDSAIRNTSGAISWRYGKSPHGLLPKLPKIIPTSQNCFTGSQKLRIYGSLTLTSEYLSVILTMGTVAFSSTLMLSFSAMSWTTSSRSSVHSGSFSHWPATTESFIVDLSLFSSIKWCF